MTEAEIKAAVSRFLTWKLPEDFSPDGGISFKATFNENTPHPMKAEPTGTNLLTATQAEAMIRYILGVGYMDTKEPTTAEQNLQMMRSASDEIKGLRRTIDNLAPKADAYDAIRQLQSMMPRQSQGFGQDVAWALDKLIADQTGEVGK